MEFAILPFIKSLEQGTFALFPAQPENKGSGRLGIIELMTCMRLSLIHISLRGPRGGFVICKEEYAKKLDAAVFPGMQAGVGGGHNLSIYMSRAELEEISEGLITRCV